MPLSSSVEGSEAMRNVANREGQRTGRTATWHDFVLGSGNGGNAWGSVLTFSVFLQDEDTCHGIKKQNFE